MLRGALPLLITVCGVTPLLSQTVTPSYLPEDEPPIQLEPLEVQGRNGGETYVVERIQSATKTDTPLVNVPQSLTVITSELIRDQAMSGIADVTRYAPGVGIAQGEGNRDTPVLRGSATTADFFVDGVRDDVQYFRDLYNVDRVEVLKGPSALIFGRGGSGGVINRVTEKARGLRARVLTLQAGSWDHYRLTADIEEPLHRDLAVRAVGFYEDSGSYRDGVTLERHGFNPTLRWQVASSTSLTAGYEYFRDKRVADRGVSSFQGRPLKTDPSTFFGDPDQSLARARVNSVYAIFDHAFANGASLRNHTRFGAYEKFYQNVFPGAVDTSGTNVSISAYNNATDRDTFFNVTDLVLPLETGPITHRLLAGLELGRQETDNFRQTGYFTTISPTTTSIQVPVANPRSSLPVEFRQSATDADNHGVADITAFYAQDQIVFSEQFHAILGARVERLDLDFFNNRTGLRVESDDTEVLPRAGLIYKPAPAVSVYASYSITYVPRAGEQLASLTLENSALKPEEYENYEVGVKWDLRPDLALTAAVYQLDRSNVAITDPADPTRMLLVNGQRASGLELGVTGRLSKNWSVAGGYAYQDGEIKTTQSATIVEGARLAQLPRHTFSLWNRYDFDARWGVGLGVIYRDEIFANVDNRVTIPGFVRVDAALFWRINESVRAQLNVENLLDREYFVSAHNNTNITPGSPVAVRASITTRF